MYPGPVRDEPLAIELHNTLYYDGEPKDGLATLPLALEWTKRIIGDSPHSFTSGVRELRDLRDVVRSILDAHVNGRSQSPNDLERINRYARKAKGAVQAQLGEDGTITRRVEYLAMSHEDVLFGRIAHSTIELITAADTDIHVCGAPNCVLMYQRSHKRRQWCSDACGNRARQARHYAKSRRTD